MATIFTINFNLIKFDFELDFKNNLKGLVDLVLGFSGMNFRLRGFGGLKSKGRALVSLLLGLSLS